MIGNDDRIERAAIQLRDAAERRTPCSPVRDIVGSSTDVDLGYAIQEVNTAWALQQGRRVSGRKIGITSRAVMQQVGVDQPDFGTLFVDMEYGDGAEIEGRRLLQPRAEAEVALVLGADLDRGQHSFVDVIRATAFALPAIEIVDSRVAGWDITIVDTVADNASCGVYVLGSRPVAIGHVDVRQVSMAMSINGHEVSTGRGVACLGNPLLAARWLADTCCSRGMPLRAGDVVLTGALGPMRPLVPGDTVAVDFGEFGSVSVSLAP